ncbi:hypothetical protein [Planktothrix agardhii]
MDLNKIVVIGGSSGGHLATLCSILPNAAGFDLLTETAGFIRVYSKKTVP